MRSRAAISGRSRFGLNGTNEQQADAMKQDRTGMQKCLLWPRLPCPWASNADEASQTLVIFEQMQESPKTSRLSVCVATHHPQAFTFNLSKVQMKEELSGLQCLPPSGAPNTPGPFSGHESLFHHLPSAVTMPECPAAAHHCRNGAAKDAPEKFGRASMQRLEAAAVLLRETTVHKSRRFSL